MSRSKLISRPYHGQMTNIWEENAMKEMRMTVPPTLWIGVGQHSAGTNDGREGGRTIRVTNFWRPSRAGWQKSNDSDGKE